MKFKRGFFSSGKKGLEEVKEEVKATTSSQGFNVDREKDIYDKEFKRTRIELEGKIKDYEGKPMNSKYFQTCKNYERAGNHPNWWV